MLGRKREEREKREREERERERREERKREKRVCVCLESGRKRETESEGDPP
jgi:hypothetical protein